LFSKLKSHELSHKAHPYHDASFTNKALITSARVGGHDANPTNTISPSLECALPSLAAASDEQYESILDDEIALLANFGRCTYFGRRGEETPETPRATLSAMTPPTSLLTTPRGRSVTTPTRMTTPTITITRRTTRRRIAPETRRRSCSEHVQP
jgi:hypothetical protein